MSTSIALSNHLHTVHEIFTRLDSSVARAPIAATASALALAGSTHEHLRALAVGLARSAPEAAAALSLLAVRLGALATAGSSAAVARAQVTALGEDYERVLSEMSKVRSAVHVMNAVIGVVTYEFFVPYSGAVGIMLAVFLAYVAMDVARRVVPGAEAGLFDGLFGAVTRPRERYIVPAATWYCLGMLLATAFAEKTVAQVSVLVLGFGDPIASVVGKRLPLLRFPNKKSVGGFLGAVAGSGVVAYAWLTLVLGHAPLPSAERAVVAATAGAAAELLGSDRLDDNLLIPLAAWAAQAYFL